MPRLAAETKVARRQQLIDAAWRCVADRGFQSLTVDEVCAEAGVSKGAFYLYFESKQDLLLGLLEDEAAEIDAFMADLERADLGGVERLRRFTRVMIERGDDPARLQDPCGPLVGDVGRHRRSRRKWVAVVRARRAVLKRWIEASIASGELASIPANALAAILLALGDGLLLHAGLIHPASAGATLPRPSMRSWTG